MPLDDDPLTSPSFPAINTSDSRSYRTRRPGGAPSGPHTGPLSGPQPTAQYPLDPTPQPLPPAPVANPYGSYVSAPQPVYQDVAASHPDSSFYGGGYANGQQANGQYANGGQHANGQQADSSWYSGAASGYLPADYGRDDHAGDGDNGDGYNGNGYPAVDYQNAGYQGAAYQAPAGPGGYGPQGQLAGQYDPRGYSAPDLAYGQDGYQGYPNYGAGGR